MANEYNVYDQFDASNLGNDIELGDDNEGGDFLISPTGDIGEVTQLNNLKRAIKRRLFTAEGALGRQIRDPYGVYSLNTDYGNAAYRFLSEPMTAELLSQLRDTVVQCLLQEPRIVVDTVEPIVETSFDGTTYINLIARYTVVETDTTDNIVINYNPTTGTLS